MEPFLVLKQCLETVFKMCVLLTVVCVSVKPFEGERQAPSYSKTQWPGARAGPVAKGRSGKVAGAARVTLASSLACSSGCAQ